MAFIKSNQLCPSCNKYHLNINEDGSAKCFYANCTQKDGWFITGTFPVDGIPKTKQVVNMFESIVTTTSIFSALLDRNISEATAKKYGVKVVNGLDGKPTQHHYPYYNGHELSATKIRKLPKDFALEGSFDETGLFGEQLFNKGGKYITITEGECDAMAAYELLGSKWAAVSIKRGASGAERDVKDSLEFLESFDNIVFC